MPTWTVTLQGNLADLETLASLGVGVTREGDGFMLRLPELENVTELMQVHQYAVEQLQALNGLRRMAWGDDRAAAIMVGSIVRVDAAGHRTDFVILKSLDMRMHGATLDIGGRTFAARAALAARDDNVRQALRRYGGEVSPVNLYRVFEIIRDAVGGEREIVARAWSSQAQTDRFRRTMNSVGALGLDARHGVEKSAPPPDPMSIQEAQEFIARLLERWLDAR